MRTSSRITAGGRVLCATALVVSVTGCGSDGTAAGASAVAETGSTEGVRSETGDPDDVAAASRVVADWGASLAAQDVGSAVGASVGPAAVYLRHVAITAVSSDDDTPFDAVNTTQLVDEPRREGQSVVFPGPLVYGPADPPPPPRLLTDIVLVDRDGEWKVERFARNGIPIDLFVAESTEGGSETDQGVTGRVVAVFHDATCREDLDPDCPEELRDAVAVDVEVDNGTAHPLEPTDFWLETDNGRVDAMDAGASGFPPGEVGVGGALFPAARSLAKGAVLHLRFDSAGTAIELALPVPPYVYP